MKRILIATFMLLAVVVGVVYSSGKADAASKTVYVNAKSDIILRDQPVKNAKQIGTVKNKSAVTLLSTKQEWSYIQAGKQKGYVYSSALSAKNPNKKVTGGLYPKAGLTLIYSPDYYAASKKGVEKYHTCGSKEYTSVVLVLSTIPCSNDVNYGYAVGDYVSEWHNNTKWLDIGVAESDVTFGQYKYPMTEGSYTYEYTILPNEDFPEKVKIFVESTTKTVKVKAGTFENVVILKAYNNYRYYFVKDIGLIKITDGQGRTISELILVENEK
ncbi:SH3 domain-containing protein [Bacillus ndiopicus]|uniref:SH3 domain-containing protein n=1 Tax=Bacillus ndiopicus TaxID=1347368 RepID=UPI0006936565|nr:SH3 domain-containing protein [Bacillus ndiopicus]